MSASANLNSLLRAQSEKKYYEQQLLILTSRYEANLESLNNQLKYQEKYEDAYENCFAMDKAYSVGSKKFVVKETKGDEITYKLFRDYGTKDAAATAYAKAKVSKYNEELLEELSDKDVAFDSLKTTMQAMCDAKNAEIETLKQSTQTECANTYMLSGN